MAWTTPRTWVAAELVTASLLNTHVRDDLNALRDYMLGAQDLGSNWKIGSGRLLDFTDADVAHGMTGLAPTDVYLRIQSGSGTAGGAYIQGTSDADTTGIVLFGINGQSAAPANAGLHFYAAKKSGTSYQDFAASEPAIHFRNGSTALGNWYGAGLNVVGGLAVGYSGVPTTGMLQIGDSQFQGFVIAGTAPTLLFDAAESPGAGIYYDRTNDGFSIKAGNGVGTFQITVNRCGPSGVGFTLDCLEGGTHNPSQTIQFTERATPSPPDANRALLYSDDNGSGKTRIMAIFNTGAAQVIATQP